MNKPISIIVISGLLIIAGLVLLILGNQIILEGFSQGDGKVNLDNTVMISTDLNIQDTSKGVFAVQVMEFKENTLFVKILDPSDIEIVTQEIDKETIGTEFDVLESGTYKLVIQSSNDDETHVFGAIGPLPDANKEIVGDIAIIILISGMIGLVGVGIYGIKNRKRSI